MSKTFFRNNKTRNVEGNKTTITRIHTTHIKNISVRGNYDTDENKDDEADYKAFDKLRLGGNDNNI